MGEMEISNGKLRERLKIMKGRLADVETELAKTDALLNESQKMSLKLNEDQDILVKERAEKTKRKQEVRERMKRLAENGNFTEETETKEYTLSDKERLSESELERAKRIEKRKRRSKKLSHVRNSRKEESDTSGSERGGG